MLKHQISSNEQNLKHENLEKIEKISHFDYGWNGNGGLKFTREAIDEYGAHTPSISFTFGRG